MWLRGQKDKRVQEQKKTVRFEQSILPHVNAAYNLARWLTRNDQDAEDVVQEAFLRAFRYFDGFHGDDSRAWLLAIVRNHCYTWLKQNRAHELTAVFDEDLHSGDTEAYNPERIALQNADSHRLKESLEELPVEFREAIILRELEGFSYKEIADITNVPLGTVMSRLARARKRLQQSLTGRAGKELRSEL